MDKAIARFVQNVEGLTRLPLVTDQDMFFIWGEEVIESLYQLSIFNQKENICGACKMSCCPSVHCELYYPGFSECPIFPLRPPICRMHYCKRFAVNDISFVKEFGDIFLNSLLEAKIAGSKKADLFDSPPLSRFAPQLVDASRPWLEAFREGQIDEQSALKSIRQKAESFLTPPASPPGCLQKDIALERALEDARWYYKEHLI